MCIYKLICVHKSSHKAYEEISSPIEPVIGITRIGEGIIAAEVIASLGILKGKL